MKAMKKYIGILMGLVLLASCKSLDYPDRFEGTSGVPEVNYVRYADRDLLITQAAMEETICIVGDNLTSVHDIYFNDQPAVLNTSYMTFHALIVTIPRTLPEVQDDKIHLITRDSTVVLYDFKVLPPAPKVSAMSCEWAPVGETVTITGSYLFAPLTVEFPGADPVEVTVSTGDAFDVVVPAGAQPGKIKVTNSSGTGQSLFQYKDSRGMLFDFDGLTGLDNHGWNGHSSQDDDGTGIAGRFFQFGDGTAVLDGSWEENYYSFVYWPGTWNDPENYDDGVSPTPRLCDIVDFSKWSNMALKFEMYIPSSNPWQAGAMQLIIGGVDVITGGGEGVLDIYGNVTAGANNTFISGDGVPQAPRALYIPWKDSGSFDTGDKWITVSFPYTTFAYNSDGTANTEEIKPESFTSLTIFVWSGGVTGTDCQPIIKIDNIRAVPIK